MYSKARATRSPRYRKGEPEVVRLPRKPNRLHVCYTLIVASGETFGPFKSEAQAVMFAAVRWPKEVPAWHIERHAYHAS